MGHYRDKYGNWVSFPDSEASLVNKNAFKSAKSSGMTEKNHNKMQKVFKKNKNFDPRSKTYWIERAKADKDVSQAQRRWKNHD